MTPIDSLAISLPMVITILGLLIAFLNYRLNKQRASKSDSQEDIEKQKKADTERQEINMKLLSIEKDVQYIRISVDKIDKKQDDHERRIQKLEKTCRTMKGGK